MLMYGALLVNEEHNKKTGIPEGFVEVQRDDTNKIYDSDAAAACACSAHAFEFEGSYEDGSKYHIWVVPVADVAELHPLAKVYRAHEHALSGRYAEAIQDLSDTRDVVGHHIGRIWMHVYESLQYARRDGRDVDLKRLLR